MKVKPGETRAAFLMLLLVVESEGAARKGRTVPHAKAMKRVAAVAKAVSPRRKKS